MEGEESGRVRTRGGQVKNFMQEMKKRLEEKVMEEWRPVLVLLNDMHCPELLSLNSIYQK
jgi:hypothetical protein